MAQKLTPERRAWHLKQLKPLPRLLRALRAAKIHADGDCMGIVLRWWHPLAWLTMLFVIGGTFCMDGAAGVREVLRDDLNFYVTSRYYREHLDEIEWI